MFTATLSFNNGNPVRLVTLAELVRPENEPATVPLDADIDAALDGGYLACQCGQHPAVAVVGLYGDRPLCSSCYDDWFEEALQNNFREFPS